MYCGECESGFSFLGIGNQILSSVALFSVLEVEEIGAGTYSHVVLTHILVWNLSIYFQCHTQTKISLNTTESTYN